MIEGSLEAKLPPMWTHGKAQPGRSSAMEIVRREKIRDGEDKRWRRSEVEKARREKMQLDLFQPSDIMSSLFPVLPALSIDSTRGLARDSVV